MDIELQSYRKIMTLIVTAAVVFALQRYGLGPRDLPAFGFQLTGITGPVVDFLLQIGIPAVFALAQPNEKGESLLTYWRWIAVGLVVVVLLVLLAVLVP